MTLHQINNILSFIKEKLDDDEVDMTLSIIDKYGNKYELDARVVCVVNESITDKDDIIQIPIENADETTTWVYLPVEYIASISTTLRD